MAKTKKTSINSSKYFQSGKWAERAETSRKIKALTEWAVEVGKKIGVKAKI